MPSVRICLKVQVEHYRRALQYSYWDGVTALAMNFAGSLLYNKKAFKERTTDVASVLSFIREYFTLVNAKQDILRSRVFQTNIGCQAQLTQAPHICAGTNKSTGLTSAATIAPNSLRTELPETAKLCFFCDWIGLE